MRQLNQSVVGKLAKILPGLALALMANGCVIVSLHSTRPVRVHVKSHEDGKPLANASVTVEYGQYAGYGVYYVLRVPKPEAAVTDTNGDATIPLATFSQYINFFVNGNKFAISPDLIRYGGVTYCVSEWKPPAPDVSLTPLKPYHRPTNQMEGTRPMRRD